MALLVLKEKSKNLFLTFFLVSFFVLSFWIIQPVSIVEAVIGAGCSSDIQCGGCEKCSGVWGGTCYATPGSLPGVTCLDASLAVKTMGWDLCESDVATTYYDECIISNPFDHQCDRKFKASTGCAPNLCCLTGTAPDSQAECKASCTACTPAAPTVTVTPDTYSGPAATQIFSISATRNDSSDCTSASIPLTASCTVDTPSWTSNTTSAVVYDGTGTQTVDVPITASGRCTFIAKSPDDNALTASMTVVITVTAGLNVVASESEIPLGSATLVVFTVKNGTTPVSGAAVSFSGAANGSCASNTNLSGNCTASITPSVSGTITVTAQFGVDEATTTINVPVGGGGGACSSTGCSIAFAIPCTCGGATTSAANPFCGIGPTCPAGQVFATQDLCRIGCGFGGGGPGGGISAPLCQSALVASDVDKLCGVSYTVVAVDVGSWCCSAANGVALNQGICQAMDPACAAAAGVEICSGGVDEDGDGDTDCADSDCAADPACAAVPPAASCSGPGMYVSPLGPGYCTIEEILGNATSWILTLVSSIIILIIIIGGLMYISSAGDEERLRTSKNIIFYAIVGLAIILISYALINEVTNLLKGP